MVTQVVEIAENGKHLSKHRGFMLVAEDRQEKGRVPLDDITALILSAPQITLSKTLLMALAERKTPVIACGQTYHPQGFFLPYDIHYDQTGILWTQIDSSKVLLKRLWQAIIKEKISNQATALDIFKPDHKANHDLAGLQKRVKSGDPDNVEAQAARYYWPALMGANFRRDRQASGANSLLNYGYSILRAATARAVCGAGLTPAIGLHHRNRKNAYALVDDLIEPFRPVIDIEVINILSTQNPEEVIKLTPDTKRRLAKILDQDVRAKKGVTSLMNALHRSAQTLVQSLEAKENRMEFPAIKTRGLLI